LKVSLNDQIVVLSPETEEEREILSSWEEDGVKLTHSGSTTGIASPALAGLKGVYLEPEERVLLAYAVGRLRRFWPMIVVNLIGKLIGPQGELEYTDDRYP